MIPAVPYNQHRGLSEQGIGTPGLAFLGNHTIEILREIDNSRANGSILNGALMALPPTSQGFHSWGYDVDLKSVG